MKCKVLDNQIAIWDTNRETEQFFENCSERTSFKPYNQHDPSATPKRKPAGLIIEKGLYWCPYCRQKVSFVKDTYLGIKRCPLCGISENDFHVKQENRKKR